MSVFVVFALGCAIASILLIFGLWLYYDYKQMAFYQAKASWSAFYCSACDQLYAYGNKVNSHPCPHCSKNNTHLQF